MTRIVRAALAVCAILLVALIAFARAGGRGPLPVLVALVGAVGAVAAATALGLALLRLRAGARVGAVLAEALVMVGILLLVGAGLANWAFEYRALLLLEEGGRVALGDERQARAMTVGPLARWEAPAGALRLVRVRLVPEGSGFLGQSELRYTDPNGSERALAVVSGRPPARAGKVDLYQGAFGFVARLIVEREGKLLLDRWVPIESRIDPGRAIAFEQTVELKEAGVTLAVAVALDRLDEAMKGHPVLGVELRKDAALVGAGELLPGHGAELKDGWHVGFGGMKRWSEIDAVRPDHGRVSLAGFAVLLAGLLGLAGSWWRGR